MGLCLARIYVAVVNKVMVNKGELKEIELVSAWHVIL
jgi:hypothetical protein